VAETAAATKRRIYDFHTPNFVRNLVVKIGLDIKFAFIFGLGQAAGGKEMNEMVGACYHAGV
jgi:hypothetical protein